MSARDVAVPGWDRVATQELWETRPVRLREWLVLAAVAAMVAMPALLESARVPGEVLIRGPATAMALVALFHPLSLWSDIPPSRRGFRWARPVSPAFQDVWRVAAGAFWLVLVSLGMLLLAMLATLAMGEPMLPPAHQVLLTVTGPLVVYLLVSALAVGAEHPTAWLLAFLFGLGILGNYLAFTADRLGTVERVFDAVVEGRYGLGTALSGVTERRTLQTMTVNGTVVHSMVGSGPPRVSEWLLATAMWGGAGVLALRLVTLVRREV